jgi:phage-related protein
MSRVTILDACIKEMKKFPTDVKKDILMFERELDKGVKLSMPLSRPMPSIGSGVHELRLKDKGNQYRVIYYFMNDNGHIYLIHAFNKKTQTTDKRNIDLAKRRIRSLK